MQEEMDATFHCFPQRRIEDHPPFAKLRLQTTAAQNTPAEDLRPVSLHRNYTTGVDLVSTARRSIARAFMPQHPSNRSAENGQHFRTAFRTGEALPVHYRQETDPRIGVESPLVCKSTLQNLDYSRPLMFSWFQYVAMVRHVAYYKIGVSASPLLASSVRRNLLHNQSRYTHQLAETVSKVVAQSGGFLSCQVISPFHLFISNASEHLTASSHQPTSRYHTVLHIWTVSVPGQTIAYLRIYSAARNLKCTGAIQLPSIPRSVTVITSLKTIKNTVFMIFVQCLSPPSTPRLSAWLKQVHLENDLQNVCFPSYLSLHTHC